MSQPGPNPPPRLLPPLILLRDLEGQLIWPRLLRSPAAALWPSRLMLGVLAALLIGLVGSLSTLWSDRPAFIAALSQSQATAWGDVGRALAAADLPQAAGAIRGALVQAPLGLLAEYPVSTPVLLPIMLAVLIVFGAGVARSVAVESGTDRRPSAPLMLGWSLARAPSTLAALGVPLVALWLLIVLMRGLGWLGLALPVVDVAGGLLFPVQMLLGVLVIALLLGLGVAGPMVVPARMVEDSDAFDAVQRSVAYTLARPLRLALYLGVTALGVGLAMGLAVALLAGGWSLAIEQSGAWLSAERQAALTGVMPPEAAGGARELPTTTAIARWLVRLWSNVPTLLIAGYAISLFFTASTRVYLAMRQVCDGQDPGEIQGAERAGASTPDGSAAAPAGTPADTMAGTMAGTTADTTAMTAAGAAGPANPTSPATGDVT